ncbi:MAG: prepilin-type N-terminal cleavage/methylation domain-containing protein [Patescibacteria group bacterium]
MSAQPGFTLIELLVVIFIIGILAGILLPNYVSSRERARDAARKQDLASVKNALRLYYNDNQSYPAAVGFGSAWTPYMAEVPDDPVEGQSYDYCVADDDDGFVVCAELENAGDASISESDARCGGVAGTICACTCTDNCYYVCAN